MTDSTIQANWESGVLPTLALAPHVATPLLGSVLFGLFTTPRLVPFLYGPTHYGKHALAGQIAEIGNGGADPVRYVVVDDTDARAQAEAIRSSFNGGGRISPATGKAEKLPAVIAVGAKRPTAAADTRTWPLHLDQPIPRSELAQTLRKPALLARQMFGASFQVWLAQQDEDQLYDRYLDTWHDDETEDRRLLDARTAAAYGLTLAHSFLEDAGVDVDPDALRLANPASSGSLPDVLEQLSTALPASVAEGEVELLNSTYVPQEGAPLVGRLADSRAFLIPSVVLGTVLPAGASTSRGLGAALERHGYLRRSDAAADVHTTVVKIEGKARRAWDVDCALFGGAAALGGAPDLDYFARVGSIRVPEARMLEDLLTSDRNIIITGRPASGKTLLLQAMVNTLQKVAPEVQRLFWDDLLEKHLNDFQRMSINERPFVATITASTPTAGVDRFRSRPFNDEWSDTFTAVHIDRNGATWNLEISENGAS